MHKIVQTHNKSWNLQELNTLSHTNFAELFIPFWQFQRGAYFRGQLFCLRKMLFFLKEVCELFVSSFKYTCKYTNSFIMARGPPTPAKLAVSSAKKSVLAESSAKNGAPVKKSPVSTPTTKAKAEAPTKKQQKKPVVRPEISDESSSEDDAISQNQDIVSLKSKGKSKSKSSTTKTQGVDNGRGVIYIGHLPFGFFEDQLRGFFSQFGTITRLRLSRNKKVIE